MVGVNGSDPSVWGKEFDPVKRGHSPVPCLTAKLHPRPLCRGPAHASALVSLSLGIYAKPRNHR